MKEVFSYDILKCLIDLIPDGEENAIHVDDLAKQMKTDGTRIKRMVTDIRKQNICLICSSSRGYFKPVNDGEIEQFYNRMMKRQKTGYSYLNHFRQHIKKSQSLRESD